MVKVVNSGEIQNDSNSWEQAGLSGFTSLFSTFILQQTEGNILKGLCCIQVQNAFTARRKDTRLNDLFCRALFTPKHTFIRVLYAWNEKWWRTNGNGCVEEHPYSAELQSEYTDPSAQPAPRPHLHIYSFTCWLLYVFTSNVLLIWIVLTFFFIHFHFIWHDNILSILFLLSFVQVRSSVNKRMCLKRFILKLIIIKRKRISVV